jgi:hypothetical protein
VLFAAVITLFVVPSGYLALEDLRRFVRRKRGREEPARAPAKVTPVRPAAA